MSAGLAASTVTPGSAPPVASLTTPAIALCADARPPMSASADITSTAVINLGMYVLLSFGRRQTPATLGCGLRRQTIEEIVPPRNGARHRIDDPGDAIAGIVHALRRRRIGVGDERAFVQCIELVPGSLVLPIGRLRQVAVLAVLVGCRLPR